MAKVSKSRTTKAKSGAKKTRRPARRSAAKPRGPAGLASPRRPGTLAQCRGEIDRVDESIIALLDERARIARRVGEIKAERGDDFFDAGRHLQLLHGISRRGMGDFPPEGLRDVFREILSSCLNLEALQTIAFLGPEATFTHIAARRTFGRSARFVPYENIADIFMAVEKNVAN
ncbi:chorismate mutase, partial [Candidatus Sumerlaeota bacterium]|nr:chorismate mutase [Candidatus Sumerlaeota bacterium]